MHPDPTDTLIVHFDGLCDRVTVGGPRNPDGCGCGGWIITQLPDGIEATVTEGHACYGHGPGMTNNVAEWRAALDALRCAAATGWRGRVLLRGDSQLVINQVTGAWRSNMPHLRALRDELRQAMTLFERVDVAWVPREENEPADALSRVAYERATGLRPR